MLFGLHVELYYFGFNRDDFSLFTLVEAKPSRFSPTATNMWVAFRMPRKREMACASGLLNFSLQRETTK